MEFIEALQTPNKVKHPTQMGFNLQKWESARSKFTFNDPQSRVAHDFGTIIFKTLEGMREYLSSLEDKRPKTLNEIALKRHYVSLSNRHRVAFSKLTQRHLESLKKEGSTEYLINHLFDMPGALVGTEEDNNRLTLTDSAHQLVDNMRLILGSLVSKRAAGGRNNECEAISEDQWLYEQEILSSVYGLVESYWHLVVYKESFPRFDKRNNRIVLNPLFTEFNVAKAVSLTRMDNHRTATAGITGTFVEKYKNLIDYSFPVESFKKKGVNYKVTEVKNYPLNFVAEYVRATNEIEDINDSISFNVCSKTSGSFDFSLNEVLDVFIQIRLFSLWKFENLDRDTAFDKRGDLFKFNIEVDCKKIALAISRCIEMPTQKVIEIIEFLHFHNGRDEDLWSNPLVKKNSSKSFLLIAPFMDSVISRNIEFWIRKLKIQMSEKGQGFEEYIRGRIYSVIDESELSRVSVQIPDQKISISGKFEEIDSLVFVGNRALVLELKNIVSVDSPVSYGTATKRVKEGIEQAKRKADFVRNNLETIVKRYDIGVDAQTVTVVPVVFVSNFIFAGNEFDGVPITDKLIFEAFFKKNRIPILTKDLGESLDHKIEAKIYESSSDACENIEQYLKNPPQLRLIKNSLYCTYHESAIEIFGDKKCVLRSIHVNQSHDEKHVIETDFGFPLIVNE